VVQRHQCRDEAASWMGQPTIAVMLAKKKLCGLPPKRVLHIDHLFARMQRLNTYEAKTNAMTRIGSNLSQVLPPPFSTPR
jgi:hypothetical protein